MRTILARRGPRPRVDCIEQPPVFVNAAEYEFQRLQGGSVVLRIAREQAVP